jgi:hypothetical protein
VQRDPCQFSQHIKKSIKNKKMSKTGFLHRRQTVEICKKSRHPAIFLQCKNLNTGKTTLAPRPPGSTTPQTARTASLQANWWKKGGPDAHPGAINQDV